MIKSISQENKKESEKNTNELATILTSDQPTLEVSQKIDEDRVQERLYLTQHITEFLVKEKNNIPYSAKTALKEALIELLEL